MQDYLNCKSYLYDFEEKTLEQLLNKFFDKINNCIDEVNLSKEFWEFVKTQGLKDEVIKQVEELYNNGKLTELINKLANDVNLKVETLKEEVSSQLEQKASLLQLSDLGQLKRNKDDLIEPQDLSNATKQLLIADKVAVVEEDSVGREELKDNGVSYEKILKNHLNLLSNLNTKNLFNNYILDSEINGFTELTNAYFDSFIKMDGFNTLRVGGDVPSSRAYQRNFNILDTNEYIFSFHVLSLKTTHIKISILGYKNNANGNTIISNQYIVNGERDIAIIFNSDNSLYDEYRFVFDVTTDGTYEGKVAWFGKIFVGINEGNVNYSMNENLYELYLKQNSINNIMIKNPLYGKVISFNGDSISAGQGCPGGYGKIIAERNNMIYENISKNGSSITKGLTDSSGSPRNVLSESIDDMRADADYIVLEGGINDAFDWKSGKLTKIGTVSSDYTSELDNTTFCGAMEMYLRNAKLRFKGKKILFVIVHRMPYISSPYLTGSKNTFTELRELIITICNKYSIKYVDLFNSGLNTCIDEYNTTYTVGDGIHLNELGYITYYVDEIEKALINM